MRKNRKILFALTLISFIGFGVETTNHLKNFGDVYAAPTVVQFGSGRTNNWTGSVQNTGTDYVGMATLAHYEQVTSSNLFGSSGTLDSAITITFKVGAYGGVATPTAQAGTIKVDLLDSGSNILSSGTGTTAINNATESYAQGPTITVAKPSAPQNIAVLKVYFSSINTAMTTSKYMRLEEISLDFSLLTSKSLSSISVTAEPTKKTYWENEAFVSTGTVIEALYSDSSTVTVTSSCLFTPSTLVLGTTSITVSYTESGTTKTTSISGIIVNPILVTSISIKTATSKTSFSLGEGFSHPGLVITANYNNGNIVDYSTGFSVTGVDTKVLGSQTATITYGGQTTSYSINVTNNGALIGPKTIATDLFISEYIEGSSNDKAVELFNGTGFSVTLSGVYTLKINVNGGTSWSSAIALSGSLSNNSTFVIANSASNASILALTNQTSGSLTHNGNDAIGLFKNDVLIDIIGIFNNVVTNAWDVGATVEATKDHVIVRKATVSSPVSTWDTAQWDVYDNGTITYLGSHSISSANATALEQASSYAVYFLSQTSASCTAGNGSASPWSTLSAEYGYMAAATKDEFYSNSTDTDIIAAKARYTLLVQKYSSLAADNFMKNSSGTAYVVLSANEGSILPTAEEQPLQIVLIVALLGVTALAGYFITSRRKEEQA